VSKWRYSPVKVTRPLGKGLDESAVNAVKSWKFLPTLKAGQPAEWTRLVEVSFRFF